MNLRSLPKLRDSLSFLYVEHCRIERDTNALQKFDDVGVTHIPVASLGVLLLGPGTAITHEAVKVATENGCSLVWTGEHGVRAYAQGMGETRSAARLLRQAALHAHTESRAAVVIRMYEKRFGEVVAPGTTIEQIRGREGVRVRTAYQRASRDFGVAWSGRTYDRGNWSTASPVNRALSCAAACLYGICHCAIISAGYSPALGFIHTGKLLSFVYDVADLYRIDLAVPIAFEVAALHDRGELTHIEREVRLRCRDVFRRAELLDHVVKDIDELMQPEEAELERARTLLDAADDPPAGLWDPAGEEVAGGVNHGGDDP
ncbi:MAG TPA: type I-E CRISPR-associated endonuclease Cas1e [Anaeromyxobacter sp.]|nr:type I-E CRISPR-associated endonuclease Cas1e [Anaeromyxobacter sp.]